MGTDASWSAPLPAVPASAGAILLDRRGHLLVLKPTYKSGWTIPGGVMESGGESPWDACRREVLEETALVIESGRLVCVDTRPAATHRRFGLRFLFHCGRLDDAAVAAIRVQRAEVDEHRFVRPEKAFELLRKPVRRRVQAALGATSCIYLENGRPVPGVET